MLIQHCEGEKHNIYLHEYKIRKSRLHNKTTYDLTVLAMVIVLTKDCKIICLIRKRPRCNIDHKLTLTT